jgi:hypothetical protein
MQKRHPDPQQRPCSSKVRRPGGVGQRAFSRTRHDLGLGEEPPIPRGKQVPPIWADWQGMVSATPADRCRGLRTVHPHDIGPTILELAACAAHPSRGRPDADAAPASCTPRRPGYESAHPAILRDLRLPGMYKDGWWLARRLAHPLGRDPQTMQSSHPGVAAHDDPVELYYLPDDFSQADNIAARHPEKVKELKTCSGPRRRSTRSSCWPGLVSSVLYHAPRANHIHLLRGRAEHRVRHDPPDLQPPYTISADLVIPPAARRASSSPRPTTWAASPVRR